jgi:hypothetical protein
MTPARKRFVVAFTCALVGAHLVAIAGQIDNWPLSNYDMFASPKQSTIKVLVLAGVTSGGTEAPLQEPQFWKPYSPSKLAHCLRDAKRMDEKRSRRAGVHLATLPAAVESLLAHYESRRQARLHAGPPLAGLRL